MKYLISLCLILFLGACVSSNKPSTQYYHLPNSNFVPPINSNYGVIKVDVQVSDYLSSPSIILSDQNTNSLHLTTQHLWATYLGDSIRNNLSNKLNRLGTSGGYVFSIYPSRMKDDQLEVVIEKFQGSMVGNVEVVGHANLVDNQGKIKNSVAFREIAIQKQSGYKSMIEALDEALTLVANKIFILF